MDFAPLLRQCQRAVWQPSARHVDPTGCDTTSCKRIFTQPVYSRPVSSWGDGSLIQPDRPARKCCSLPVPFSGPVQDFNWIRIPATAAAGKRTRPCSHSHLRSLTLSHCRSTSLSLSHCLWRLCYSELPTDLHHIHPGGTSQQSLHLDGGIGWWQF